MLHACGLHVGQWHENGAKIQIGISQMVKVYTKTTKMRSNIMLFVDI